MSRTTREEHSRICEQCRRVEKELERLRVVLNDAEDQVKKLEVKMFPGRNRMLREAAEREADARANYSDAQHRLDEIKRQERLLRMKMRREESEVSVDDIPDISEIGAVGTIMIEADVEIGEEPAPKEEPEDLAKPEPEAAIPEPRHCEEDHVYEEDDREIRERTRTDDILDGIFDKGENLWNQAKRGWRVMNKMDVPQDESLRLEIMGQIFEIEAALRQIRHNSMGSIKILGAIKATNELANVKPKIVRLSHLVDSARMECPQTHFPEINLSGADGFSLLEDVLAKKDAENQGSTAQEIDAFLMELSKLRTAVKMMPEREGVVDQL